MDKRDNTFAENLAKLSINAGMEKSEFLTKFRDKIMEHEKRYGRENGCYYVASDVYDYMLKRQGFPLYQQYLKQRNKSMPHYKTRAIDAWRHIQYERKLRAWKESINMSKTLYTDSDNIAHELEENGYRIVFKLESDYDAPYDDMKHQGYNFEIWYGRGNKPDFAKHGETTRHRGNGFKAWHDISNDRDYLPTLFDVPEKYVKQFYDNKNYSRHEAYINMVASAKLAIEQDIKNYCKTNYYTIVTEVYDAEEDEIFSDSLGGVDENYAQSGAAFYEHGMLDSARKAIEKDIAEKKPESVKVNYEYGASI